MRGRDRSHYAGRSGKLKDRPERLFHYRLAKELGWSNVDAMLDSMEPRHVSEWLAYFEYESAEIEKANKPKRVDPVAHQKLMAARYGRRNDIWKPSSDSHG